MDWLYALIALVVVLLAAPMVISAFSRGDKGRRRGGGMGPALAELNAAFDPSRRHIERVAQERAVERKQGDPPSEDAPKES